MPNASIAINAGPLPLGGGLLALLRPALDALEVGGVLALLSSNAAARDDLPTWCKVEKHEYLGCEKVADADRHLIARGGFNLPRGEREHGLRLPLRDGKLMAADVLATIPHAATADPATGLAPRGARVEPGGPEYPFTLNERDRVAPPDVAQLYDQAVAAQWNAQTDIAWAKIKPLPRALETAVGQLMTFLAENELSALYLPSKFIARIHPAYVEVGMFLSTQLMDESRHIDVFLKRARANGGGLGVSSATTSASLHSLLMLEDFTEAAFLLSVLGEGTFLDLLRFIEDHAPDEPTADLVRRARADETRHVHFGMSHVRHALATDPSLYGRLENAVRKRAATLHNAGGVPAAVQDSLTVLAARGTGPAGIARGHDKFAELLHVMHENRVKRLITAGFTPEQSQTLSDLHTPNFM
ncbi:MAG: ferritin-like domain-containing protein [Planctomycetes bacterium]|nr:ferritin-like domain-containing protein [Planctomycetota bacterium]